MQSARTRSQTARAPTVASTSSDTPRPQRSMPEVVYSKNVYIVNREDRPADPGMTVARSFKPAVVEQPTHNVSYKPIVSNGDKPRNPAIPMFGTKTGEKHALASPTSFKRTPVVIDKEKAEEFYNKFLLNIPESWCSQQILESPAFGEYQNRTLQDLMENPEATMKFCCLLDTYKLLSNLTFKFKTEMDSLDFPTGFDEMLAIEFHYLNKKRTRAERLISYLSRRSSRVLQMTVCGKSIEEWLDNREFFLNCLLMSDKLYTIFNQINYVDHHRQTVK